VIKVGERGHDVEGHNFVAEVLNDVHAEVDADRTPVAAHALLPVIGCENAADKFKHFMRVLVEIDGVLQHDHDVDIAKRLGFSVSPIRSGEEVVGDVQRGVELPADLLLPEARRLVFSVGGLKPITEFEERFIDADHQLLRV
jgi:hypothetical protein